MRVNKKTAALERQYPMRRMEWPQELVEVS